MQNFGMDTEKEQSEAAKAATGENGIFQQKRNSEKEPEKMTNEQLNDSAASASEAFAEKMRGQSAKKVQNDTAQSVEDSRESFAEKMRKQGETIMSREKSRQNDGDGDEREEPAAVVNDGTDESVTASKNAFAARMKGEKQPQQDHQGRKKEYDETEPVPLNYDSREVLKEYRSQRAANGLKD